jgi:hypothetical protein
VGRARPHSVNHLASPRTVKLDQIAADLARSLGRRSNYRAVFDAETCPACSVQRGLTKRLRIEPHHSAQGVSRFVCDGCGHYVVI